MAELGTITSDAEVGTAPFETQGTASTEVAAHVALPDPHTQYTTDPEATAIADARAAAAVATHVAEPDPHTQYTTDAEATVIADARAIAAVVVHEAAPNPHPQYMQRVSAGGKSTLQTQSGGGFVSYYQLTTSALDAGTYEIHAWYAWSKSATNGDVDVQFELDSSTQLIAADGTMFREEPQDGGTDQRMSRPFIGQFVIAVGGATHTLDLMFADNGAGTARMHGCFFTVYKVA